ncbi:hypothetical protein GE09DRAFT_1088480 [Coniochaeta sp. 2T2.1]|nr:hypothetical protein GE09DRAFT_1088480 [Coniochaeta sp. 2T2.1]
MAMRMPIAMEAIVPVISFPLALPLGGVPRFLHFSLAPHVFLPPAILYPLTLDGVVAPVVRGTPAHIAEDVVRGLDLAELGSVDVLSRGLLVRVVDED